MVNRILIRIKVIQMLYAYLLTRSEFKIITNPDSTSADTRFAFTVYRQLLWLLTSVTGTKHTGVATGANITVDKKLASSTVGKAFATNNDVRQLLLHAATDDTLLDTSVLQKVHDAIVESAVYGDFKRRRKVEPHDEVDMWITLFQTVIADNVALREAFHAMPGFSGAGLENGFSMMVATLRSYYGARAGYYQALKNLDASLRQAHKLYLSMFVLIVRLTQTRDRQLDAARNKYLATSADKNPNMRFVNNAFAKALSESKELEGYIKEYGISWTDDITLLTSLLNMITGSAIYKEYMEAQTTNWESDCEFWRQILKTVVFPSDELEDTIESESVYWNDDLHIIGTFVLKSIRIDAQNGEGTVNLLPQFKDEEDSRFGAELFEYAVRGRDQYFAYVEKFVDTANWESERIAFMDTIIMVCAIAEIINFPAIPLAVSLNEYVDIANMYSSPRSGQFVNGLLYSVVEYLKSEKIIMK